MRFRLKKSVMGVAGGNGVLALVLTGCGSSPQAGKVGTAEDPVTIRFAWWGNDSRAKTTLEVIKDFEAANPTIKVQGENTEFSSYWDKMATQIAGGTSPDVFAMSGSYPSEYATRGRAAGPGQGQGSDWIPPSLPTELVDLGTASTASSTPSPPA